MDAIAESARKMACGLFCGDIRMVRHPVQVEEVLLSVGDVLVLRGRELRMDSRFPRTTNWNVRLGDQRWLVRRILFDAYDDCAIAECCS